MAQSSLNKRSVVKSSNKKKSLVGKFIRDEWNNGDYRSVWLRRIVEETKTQYVCHVQRYAKDWKKNGGDTKLFVGKWAKRYRKIKDGLGFKTIFTRRSNPDGKSTLSIVEDFTSLKCECTYKELFQTDIRKIQDENEYPRKSLELRQELSKKRKYPFDENDFRLEEHLTLQNSNGTNPVEHWDAPITKYLEGLFKCPVYYSFEAINEHRIFSNLSKSATMMHINHFGNDKKEITFDQNYFNRTIMFWYFGDKLIFCYQDGKDTW